MNAGKDERIAALKTWLLSVDAVAGLELTPASDDASFRRYFRLQSGPKSFIAMDAPPPQEDCGPFVQIAAYLESMQLNAPRVLAANVDDGFLLLTDLGATQYLDQLERVPNTAAKLYADALAALSTMQVNGAEIQTELPPYDESLLRAELSLFHDWLCAQHLRIAFSAADEAAWQTLCNLLIHNALDQPKVFVHRDYHSRNLMVTEKDNPGILDFQDAVEGPLTYDLVSLLKDCYVQWPIARVRAWALDFYASLDDARRQCISQEQFLRYFDLMGVQRHLKAAGIFARLNLRDGKSRYLADVPRTLQYIVDLGAHYDELENLITLITDRCLPALQHST